MPKTIACSLSLKFHRCSLIRSRMILANIFTTAESTKIISSVRTQCGCVFQNLDNNPLLLLIEKGLSSSASIRNGISSTVIQNGDKMCCLSSWKKTITLSPSQGIERRSPTCKDFRAVVAKSTLLTLLLPQSWRRVLPTYILCCAFHTLQGSGALAHPTDHHIHQQRCQILMFIDSLPCFRNQLGPTTTFLKCPITSSAPKQRQFWWRPSIRSIIGKLVRSFLTPGQ